MGRKMSDADLERLADLVAERLRPAPLTIAPIIHVHNPITSNEPLPWWWQVTC